MKSKVDVSIMVDGWPMINCTLMRLPHCEVVSEHDNQARVVGLVWPGPRPPLFVGSLKLTCSYFDMTTMHVANTIDLRKIRLLICV